MSQIQDTFLNGVVRYFKQLSNFGTINVSNRNAILITLYIKQIVEGPMSVYITDVDYKIMDNILRVLNGSSCLIDYQTYCQKESMFEERYDNDSFKHLEDDQKRLGENGNFRFHII